MYKIEKNPWGYKLTFGGSISLEEMTEWVKESEKALASASSSFGVMVDMQDLKPLLVETQKKMEEGQKLYAGKGMQRSVVILSSTVLTMQFKRIAKETGIYNFERYIDTSKVYNWEPIAIDWLTKGVDPDA